MDFLNFPILERPYFLQEKTYNKGKYKSDYGGCQIPYSDDSCEEPKQEQIGGRADTAGNDEADEAGVFEWKIEFHDLPNCLDTAKPTYLLTLFGRTAYIAYRHLCDPHLFD